MPINHDEIIEEIEGHIRRFGGGFGEWCVGTGKQVSGVKFQGLANRRPFDRLARGPFSPIQGIGAPAAGGLRRSQIAARAAIFNRRTGLWPLTRHNLLPSFFLQKSPYFDI